jgi:hypothetical protein
MEADISIWQKPGHFYFALTRTAILRSQLTHARAGAPFAASFLCELCAPTPCAFCGKSLGSNARRALLRGACRAAALRELRAMAVPDEI